MDIEQFRKAGYAAVDSICDYYANIQNVPVKAQVQPGYLIDQLPTSAPEDGQEFSTIQQDFGKLILPGITHWQSPSFFAYFPSNSTFECMIADMLASSVSNPGFNWICSPACTELEQVVVEWAAKLLGLEKTFWGSSGVGGGVIMGSASDCAFTAGIAARERALRDLALQNGLVIYGSTQTHSLGAKTAVMLGLPFRAVPVSIEDNYALTGASLKEAIEADIAQGLIPFLVYATVGTTSTGAVDKIDEIGGVLTNYPTVFLHVDAAWAGVAYALPEYRAPLELNGVNKYADSFCANFHKWGLTTFDCSIFCVKNRKDLTQALDVTPTYLRSKEADAGTVIDYRNWQPALGRRFRSIKLWFVLRSYGVKGFQQHLLRGIEHCQQLEKIVKQSSKFEIVTPPSLALIVFRLNPAKSQENANIDDDELNLINQKLFTALDLRYDIFLTQTVLHSKERNMFVIRLAMGGVHTKFSDVENAWRIVEEEGEKVLSEWKAQKAME
uniref:Aromatic-L-amino-acid decarboxylase n=1 Tax=Kwoniella dejecticola CBS 10117 TaxID=1296121 RepID=A0A1A6ACA8_9TREE|nr:aromatic-L-amino-acid decarboxylase [Kwoniella dejecticola CBS 10117]OBR87685.1 aromatic-L-amino-acid decarboxylase [Kwoniella dejecticola CBS 10117]